MPNPRKQEAYKECLYCGRVLPRKRRKNGSLESMLHFSRRKYCDRVCAAKDRDGWIRDRPLGIPEDLENNSWLAGFIDGEGCFTIGRRQELKTRRNGCSFRLAVAQRDDHFDVLQTIQTRFGGYFGRQTKGRSHPVVIWAVSSQKDLLRIIAYLDQHPLRVKDKEYAIWKAAILFYIEYSIGSAGSKGNPEWVNERVWQYWRDLLNARTYREATPNELAEGTDVACKLRPIDDVQDEPSPP